MIFDKSYKLKEHMEEVHPELKYEPNHKLKSGNYYNGYPSKVDLIWHKEELMKYKKIKEQFNRKINDICNI